MGEREAEEQLLATGRDVLRQLRENCRDTTELAREIQGIVEANEAPALGAAVFAALVDHVEPSHGGGSGAAALGTVAGAAGLSGDLYKAARISRDVHAVERSIETGDPRYVERRVKNKIVGRALGRASVWRRLWR